MSRDAIEREVQRRLTDALTSAGVAQGRISLEVLYMLPTEFVRAYTNLFTRALKESPSAPTYESDNPKKKVSSDWRGYAPTATGGGKRYRTYWTIKDEKAFKAKASIDRKLKRLIAQMEAKETPSRPHACGLDLAIVLESVSMPDLRFCPKCGQSLKQA